ncbi:MAG TPA: hypothetical protein VGN07_23875 [Steroidobacteraceae bacterium]
MNLSMSDRHGLGSARWQQEFSLSGRSRVHVLSPSDEFAMSNAPALPYYVTVLFRHGHGDHFHSLEDALEYAETEIHKLLGEYEDLALQEFEGIYCQRQDTAELWRFEYQCGVARWVAEKEEHGTGKPSSAIILSFRRPKSA